MYKGKESTEKTGQTELEYDIIPYHHLHLTLWHPGILLLLLLGLHFLGHPV